MRRWARGGDAGRCVAAMVLRLISLLIDLPVGRTNLLRTAHRPVLFRFSDKKRQMVRGTAGA